MVAQANEIVTLETTERSGPTSHVRTSDETRWASRCRTTQWSDVLAAAAGGESARAAMSRLYRAYWYPVLAAVTRARGREAAAELTQEFIVSCLVERGDLSGISQRPGERFRGWLFTALRSFLKNQWKRDHRQCRDVRRTVNFVADADSDERGPCLSAVADSNPDPEQQLGRQQALSLLSGVLQRLRREYCCNASAAGVNGALRFDAVKAFLPGPDAEAADYGDVAQSLGVGTGAVKQMVCRLRSRFGQLLLAELATRVTGDGDLETAKRLLCQALSSSAPSPSSVSTSLASSNRIET